MIAYRITPANTPRWDLRRRSQKIIEGMRIFNYSVTYHYVILVLCYDFSFLLLILMKLL